MLSQATIELVYIALRQEEVDCEESYIQMSQHLRDALDAMRKADDGSLDLAWLLQVPAPKPVLPPKPCDPPDNKYVVGHRVYSRFTMNLGTDSNPVTITALVTNGTIMKVPQCAGGSYWVRWRKRVLPTECGMDEDELILAPAALQPAHVKPTL